MPRVKRGTTVNRRHKKILSMAKGYRGKRKNVYKLAVNAVKKAGQNAYRDRRLKKRSFHRLWITRINAACRLNDIKYSRFIYGLELAQVKINRKMLSEMATNHPDAFAAVAEIAKKALPPAGEAPDLSKLAKGTTPKKAAPKAEKEVKEEKAEKKAPAKKAAKKEEKAEA